MKEQALAIANQTLDVNRKSNFLREYLQAFILRSLHESEAFLSLSFVGGTALRFLYNLPRFSEDLDFSLEINKNYQPQKWFSKLKRDMQFSGFDVEIKWSEKGTIHKGWVKVADLLQEAKITQQLGQKISIKIEVDTNPPKGAKIETKAINKYFLFALQYHQLPSLMAGKIHALCTREYVKGRDWYDLFWYRTQNPPVEPNLILLQNAFNQTLLKPWNVKDWKKNLLEKIKVMPWDQLITEVSPFLERPQELKLLTKDFFEKSLEG